MDHKTDASLSELLSDPIILSLMRRDGVSRDELEQLFEELRRNLCAQEEPIAA